MNPASTWMYYRRHKKQALLLSGLVGLVTLGLSLAVALAWAITIEPMRSNRLFLTHLSVVMPSPRDSEGAAAIVAQIRAHPGCSHDRGYEHRFLFPRGDRRVTPVGQIG